MFSNLTLRKIIAYGSEDYDQALALRDRLLRKPLGLSLYDEDLSDEKNNYHLGIFRGPELAAVLVLIPRDSTTLQMRQVALPALFSTRGRPPRPFTASRGTRPWASPLWSSGSGM